MRQNAALLPNSNLFLIRTQAQLLVWKVLSALSPTANSRNNVNDQGHWTVISINRVDKSPFRQLQEQIPESCPSACKKNGTSFSGLWLPRTKLRNSLPVSNCFPVGDLFCLSQNLFLPVPFFVGRSSEQPVGFSD